MMNRQACGAAAQELTKFMSTMVMAKSATGQGLAHIQYMVTELVRTDKEMSDDKANRWLGYIQGYLVAETYVTLEDCKRINKKWSDQKGTDDGTEI